MSKQLDQHYTDMGIEPIIYTTSNKLDPYQHTIIKYVTRFRAKGGVRDLKAAALLLNKYIDIEAEAELPDEICALATLVSEILESPKEYKTIVTVGRGGLWAAANLAYALNIPHVETCPLEVIEQMSKDDILFVDGIVDSGETIEHIIVDSASLYCRESTVSFPTFHGCLVKHKDYVKMPISTPLDKGPKDA